MSVPLGGIPRERSRTVDIVWPYQTFFDGVPQYSDSFTFRTGEFTRDVNHGAARRDVKKLHLERLVGPIDTGGPFLNEKTSYWDNSRTYSANRSFYGYKGPQLPVANTLTTRNTGMDVYWAPAVTASSEMELDVFGTTAISRCAPTNPHSQVLTAIGELYRDGLPTATGVKTIRDKDIGSEFLNYQFGIAPLVADLKDLHGSLSKSEKILKQYLRDSGKMVRRRYEQPATITTDHVTKTHYTVVCMPTLVTPLYGGTEDGATRVLTTTVKSRRWFSGAFTYHAELPEGTLNNMAQKLREINHLFGVMPTPAVLWNLAPWSWASDWIYNTGDVLNNISMFQTDGLVLQYGYVMEHKTITREYHVFGYSLVNSGPVDVVQRFTSEVKSRRKATPFGFGLKLEGFSNRQWAILAALGLSKGRAVAF
jgi:hypothetical protein